MFKKKLWKPKCFIYFLHVIKMFEFTWSCFSWLILKQPWWCKSVRAHCLFNIWKSWGKERTPYDPAACGTTSRNSSPLKFGDIWFLQLFSGCRRSISSMLPVTLVYRVWRCSKRRTSLLIYIRRKQRLPWTIILTDKTKNVCLFQARWWRADDMGWSWSSGTWTPFSLCSNHQLLCIGKLSLFV